jgi:hypothetical protein
MKCRFCKRNKVRLCSICESPVCLNHHVSGVCVVCMTTPQVFYEEDLAHTCGKCGNELEIVRPGSYQCNHCEKG